MNNNLYYKINVLDNSSSVFGKIGGAMSKVGLLLTGVQSTANATRKSLGSCVETFMQFENTRRAADSLNILSDSGLKFESTPSRR